MVPQYNTLHCPKTDKHTVLILDTTLSEWSHNTTLYTALKTDEHTVLILDTTLSEWSQNTTLHCPKNR